MWSPTVIETPPVVLLVDASRNLAGWESEFCDRLFTAMTRQGLGLVGSSSLRLSEPEVAKTREITAVAHRLLAPCHVC